MPSAILKRHIYVSGWRTAVSLEDAFWDALHEIAIARGKTRAGLIAHVSKGKHENLSSALRLLAVRYYRRRMLVKR